MNVAVEWKDVLIESLKGAVFLAILERLYVTRANSWFEDHIGTCFVCSLSLCFHRRCIRHTLRLTTAARRLLLHPEPAVQPRHLERLPAVAAAVEAHQAHQQRLECKFFGFCGMLSSRHYAHVCSNNALHDVNYARRPKLWFRSVDDSCPLCHAARLDHGPRHVSKPLPQRRSPNPLQRRRHARAQQVAPACTVQHKPKQRATSPAAASSHARARLCCMRRVCVGRAGSGCSAGRRSARTAPDGVF